MAVGAGAVKPGVGSLSIAGAFVVYYVTDTWATEAATMVSILGSILLFAGITMLWKSLEAPSAGKKALYYSAIGALVAAFLLGRIMNGIDVETASLDALKNSILLGALQAIAFTAAGVLGLLLRAGMAVRLLGLVAVACSAVGGFLLYYGFLGLIDGRVAVETYDAMLSYLPLLWDAPVVVAAVFQAMHDFKGGETVAPPAGWTEPKGPAAAVNDAVPPGDGPRPPL